MFVDYIKNIIKTIFNSKYIREENVFLYFFI